VVVPGNQVYSGAATTDLTATFSNGERVFYIPSFIADAGVITVTYSSVATVTAALLKV